MSLHRRPETPALCAATLLSGCSALVFETLWFRQAGLVLGNALWSLLARCWPPSWRAWRSGTGWAPASAHASGDRSPRTLFLELAVGATGASLVAGLAVAHPAPPARAAGGPARAGPPPSRSRGDGVPHARRPGLGDGPDLARPRRGAAARRAALLLEARPALRLEHPGGGGRRTAVRARAHRRAGAPRRGPRRRRAEPRRGRHRVEASTGERRAARTLAWSRRERRTAGPGGRSPRRSSPAACCSRSKWSGSASLLLTVVGTSLSFAVMLAVVLAGIAAGGFVAARARADDGRRRPGGRRGGLRGRRRDRPHLRARPHGGRPVRDERGGLGERSRRPRGSADAPDLPPLGPALSAPRRVRPPWSGDRRGRGGAPHPRQHARGHAGRPRRRVPPASAARHGALVVRPGPGLRGRGAPRPALGAPRGRVVAPARSRGGSRCPARCRPGHVPLRPDGPAAAARDPLALGGPARARPGGALGAGGPDRDRGSPPPVALGDARLPPPGHERDLHVGARLLLGPLHEGVRLPPGRPPPRRAPRPPGQLRPRRDRARPRRHRGLSRRSTSSTRPATSSRPPGPSTRSRARTRSTTRGCAFTSRTGGFSCSRPATGSTS